jgi:hypothetical protein
MAEINKVNVKKVSAVKKEPASNIKAIVVADISKGIQASKSAPTGFKGAEKKVIINKGSIQTTEMIEGTDAGFFVAFKPVEVKDAKYISLFIKGDIFQKQGWDHYASIQAQDEDGNRFVLMEMCKEGKFGSCEGKPTTKPSAIRKGATLNISLDKAKADGMQTIQRLEIVFVGEATVDAGFSISDIQLVK